MKPILIITASPDPHADQVQQIWKSQNQPFIRLDANNFSPELYLGLSHPQKGVYLVQNGIKYFPPDFKAVWYRKPELWLDNPLPLNPDLALEYKYKKGEITSVIKQFIHQFENAGVFMLNKLTSMEAARLKLIQLNIAQSLGFTIPETIVTSSPTELEAFINTKNNCIIKSISTPYVEFGDKQMSFSSYAFTASDFQTLKDKLSFDYPILIQENITKKVELRITLVGPKIFACQIDSQSLPAASTDWRRVNPQELMHSAFELPIDISEKCLELCQKLDLHFGAIDMAITPHDEFVFFEINPNGQYLWIEEQTHMPISESIANFLTKNS